MDKTIRFDSTASRPKHGIALVYDLEGFSQFFNQPDVQDYVPKFINRVSAAVSTILYGGRCYWTEGTPQHQPLGVLPVHEKFLGDGAMYLWLNSPSVPISSGFVTTLSNRLWNLKTGFGAVVRAAYDEMPVVDLPRRIRFGLARGTIYELRRKGTRQREYIGFCINLASRLQKYCPELGFIASARLGITNAELAKNGYMRVVAKEIKGFPREIVIVDKDEYDGLSNETRETHFEPVSET